MTDSIFFEIGSWIIVTNGLHRILDNDLSNALIMLTTTYVDYVVTGLTQEKQFAACPLVHTYSMKDVMTLPAHYMQRLTKIIFFIKVDVHVTCAVAPLLT